MSRGRWMSTDDDYTIHLHLTGLRLDPDNVAIHAELRALSLRRKVAGGRGLGMFEKMKLLRRASDPTEDLLEAEKLLAYDPANTDHMVRMLQAAQRAGLVATAEWLRRMLGPANG